jgi:Cupin-like domain
VSVFAEEGAPLAATAERAGDLRFGSRPFVCRGLAAQWPAVARWRFEWLRALAPDLPVDVVVGNREGAATQIMQTTWGQHLTSLQAVAAQQAPPHQLKEFDLFARFPALRNDLRTKELFPPRAIVAQQVWIGATGARTGLHCDRLDNVAIVIVGRKRFCLAAPGTVERMRAVAPKYDRWARLSRFSFDELSSALPQDAPRPCVVDLEAGDALYLPRGWWHEVVNLDASILLSGFFGSRRRVWSTWAATGLLELAHRARCWRHGRCTCHPG